MLYRLKRYFAKFVWKAEIVVLRSDPIRSMDPGSESDVWEIIRLSRC